jgi:hypothetical protein
MDNLQVNLTLPLQWVNIALSALGKQPYETVAQVVVSIQTQAQTQLDAAQKAKALQAAESPQE